MKPELIAAFILPDSGFDRPTPVADNPAHDDERFIRLAFGQDPQKGCELLFREYYGPLCSHAIRFVHDREAACDIVSDIFCAFWQQKRYEIVTSSYRAYLYTAVRNRSFNYLQRELGHYPADSLNSAESLTDQHLVNPLNPEAMMACEELHNRVELAIEQLPAQRQRVFVMSRFEGKKYQVIADELKISRKAVEGHISKALTALRRAFRGA